MSQIDATTQIGGVLRRLHGGTGTMHGEAHEALLVPFVNDSGGGLSIGTVVVRTAADPRLRAATSLGQTILGVIAGTYSATTGEFEAVDPAINETAAVAVAGRVDVLVNAAATRGQYLRASATSGQAEPGSLVAAGTFAVVLYPTSATKVQALLLAGGQGVAGSDFTINCLITGQGSPPVVGVVGYCSIDAPGTIISVRMIANLSGSAVVGIKKFSTLAAIPGTSIVAGAPPTLSSARTSEDTTLSGWTKTLAVGDVLEFTVTSVNTITTFTCALKVRRS